jgi:hypothetical protein
VGGEKEEEDPRGLRLVHPHPCLPAGEAIIDEFEIFFVNL